MCSYTWMHACVCVLRAACLIWGTVFITNYHTSLSINFLEHLWSFSAHSSANQANKRVSKLSSLPASQPSNIHIHWQLEWLLPHTYTHAYISAAHIKCFTSSFIELVFPFFLCFLSANAWLLLVLLFFYVHIARRCVLFHIYGISDYIHSVQK